MISREKGFRALSIASVALVAAAHLVLLSRGGWSHHPVPGEPYASRPGNHSDLFPRYVGTREFVLNGTSPYSRYVREQSALGFYGRDAVRSDPGGKNNEFPFAYPIHLVIPLLPLALLPFSWAMTLFGLLSLGIVWGCTWWWICRLLADWPRFSRLSLLAGLMALAPAFSIELLRQPSVLVYLSVTASAHLVRGGHNMAAGTALALSTVKPQLAVGVVGLAALGAMRGGGGWGRVLAGFGATTLVVLGIFQVWSPGWIGEWIGEIREYSDYARQYIPLSILRGSREEAGPDLLNAAAMGFTALWAAWSSGRWADDADRSFYPFVMGLLLAMAFLPVAMVYNQVFAYPALIALLRHVGAARPVPRWASRAGVAAAGAGWVLGTVPYAADKIGLSKLVPGMGGRAAADAVWAFPWVLIFAVPLVLAAGALAAMNDDSPARTA